MSNDNKRAPQDPNDDYDDGESHAADEPTAVWDESALRAAGLTDLLHGRDKEPAAPPATPTRAVQSDPSIVIDQSLATPLPPAAPEGAPAAMQAARAEGGVIGWGTTMAIAVAVGAVVYLLIRLLKG